MARTFRQLARWLLPPWLLEGDGGKVADSLLAVIDATVERARQGLNARFPTRAPASALALIGQDRGIVRGRTETSEHYAARLVAWRFPRGHRVRGNSFALLEQFSEYFGGVDAYVIDVKGNRRELSAAGVPTYSYGNAWDWDGEGASPRWARFWVVLDLTGIASEHPDLGDPELWGGALGTPGYSIGQEGITPEDVQALRRMMRGRAWKAAGTRAEWVVVSLDGTEPAPDGTWLHWSRNVAGTQTRTRSSAFRYWSLTPDRNNVYVGDPANFASQMPLADGTLYDGNPDNFPAAITLPGGVSYAGDPDNFPASVRLVDDGDPIP